MFGYFVARMTWSYNGWRCFDHEGFRNRNKSGFEYVRVTGFAGEWLNFCETRLDGRLIDPVYYYGYPYIERAEKEGFDKIFVAFVSKNIDDGKHYLVGFYGAAECVKEDKIPFTFKDILPDYYIKHLQNLRQTTSGKALEWVLELLEQDKPKELLRAPKEFSLLLPEYIEVKPQDVYVKKWGSWQYRILTREQFLEILNKVKSSYASKTYNADIRIALNKIKMIECLIKFGDHDTT